MAGYTAAAAADLLGVSPRTALTMIERGWLKTSRARGRARRVSERALNALAVDRRLWLLVAPEDIPDPDLRHRATLARNALRPARWWSVEELMTRYHLTNSGLYTWRKAGWGGDGWLRERQCDHWMAWWGVEPPPPPPWRRSIAVAHAGTRAKADREARILLEARERGATWPEAGALLGIRGDAAFGRVARYRQKYRATAAD